MAFNQNVPINQQNALPLATIAQATPGQLQIVGGSVYRTFAPEDIGINGSVFALNNNQGLIAGNYLDLRGCTKFVVAVRCVNALVSVARPAITLAWQLRMGTSDAPAPGKLVGGSLNTEMNSELYAGANWIFPATTAPGEVLTKLLAFAYPSISNFGNNTVVMGYNMRPILTALSSTMPDSNNLFTMYMEAHS